MNLKRWIVQSETIQLSPLRPIIVVVKHSFIVKKQSIPATGALGRALVTCPHFQASSSFTASCHPEKVLCCKVTFYSSAMSHAESTVPECSQNSLPSRSLPVLCGSLIFQRNVGSRHFKKSQSKNWPVLGISKILVLLSHN